MSEVASWIEGSLTLSESTVVQHGGTMEHDLTVSANTHLDLHGAVGGDLIVEPGGIAKVRGTVLGTLYNDGARWRFAPGLRWTRCATLPTRRPGLRREPWSENDRHAPAHHAPAETK